jgi:hypothetical protein
MRLARFCSFLFALHWDLLDFFTQVCEKSAVQRPSFDRIALLSPLNFIRVTCGCVHLNRKGIRVQVNKCRSYRCGLAEVWRVWVFFSHLLEIWIVWGSAGELLSSNAFYLLTRLFHSFISNASISIPHPKTLHLRYHNFCLLRKVA